MYIWVNAKVQNPAILFVINRKIATEKIWLDMTPTWFENILLTLCINHTHISYFHHYYILYNFFWYWYYPVQRWWWLSQYLTGELNKSSCLPSSNQPEESPLSPSSSPPASTSPSPWYEPFLKFLGSHLEEKPRTWRQKDVIGEVFQDCQLIIVMN